MALYEVEHCRVAPPPGMVAQQSIPLTFYDVHFLGLPTVQTLLFYEFPHSKSHFIDTLVPTLKRSLSLTLKHFFPLAANLIVPPNPGKPYIRYIDGDSVSMTFAESAADFDHLTAYHPHSADEFYPLVPQLPQPTKLSDDTIVAPILAIQVTLFPNLGLCFGFTFRHEVADGGAFTHFRKTWAAITKLGGDEAVAAGESLPVHDRSVIGDPLGLAALFRNQLKPVTIGNYETHPHPLPTNKVRATFVLTRPDIQRLKKLVSSRRRRQGQRRPVSTFTVATAYAWVCILKSQAATAAMEDDDEREYYVFLAEGRRRLNPPLPDTYFGNCLVPIYVAAKRADLLGEEGFVAAAESIGEAIERRLDHAEAGGVLKDTETWVPEYAALCIRKRSPITTAGSPNFGFYEVDFGWGRPRKMEIISIDSTGAVSLSDSRDFHGAVEIGISLPSPTMNAFIAIFSHGLAII